jgi:hypothetical protein
MQTSPKTAVLLGFIFLIPLNIYSIGKGLGSGIQWAFFKYQSTPYGTTWFSFLQDIEYVLTGIIHGRSALSLVLWSAGSVVLLGIAILAIVFIIEGKQEIKRLFGIITILIGFIYLLSCMLQYGPTLSGPAGFCIPIGIPLIWVFALCIYTDFLRINDKMEPGENEDIQIENKN